MIKMFSSFAVQSSAIGRGCYKQGQVAGLNNSVGCRNWINEEEGYIALYCFCDTDYCNTAASNRRDTAVMIAGVLVAAGRMLMGNLMH